MLHSLLALVLEIDTPATPPAYEGDPNLVTPGVVGFIITFAIALLTVLLIVDMVRRIQRSPADGQSLKPPIRIQRAVRLN